MVSAYPLVPQADIAQTVPASAFGLAYYSGLTSEGRARINIRVNVTPNAPIIWHEAAHAMYDHAEEVTGKSYITLLEGFWKARGFPGTAAEANEKAEAALAANGGHWDYPRWRMFPTEMWSEAFAASNIDGYTEKTETYGVPLDRARVREFFANLQTPDKKAPDKKAPSATGKPAVRPGALRTNPPHPVNVHTPVPLAPKKSSVEVAGAAVSTATLPPQATPSWPPAVAFSQFPSITPSPSLATPAASTPTPNPGVTLTGATPTPSPITFTPPAQKAAAPTLAPVGVVQIVRPDPDTTYDYAGVRAVATLSVGAPGVPARYEVAPQSPRPLEGTKTLTPVHTSSKGVGDLWQLLGDVILAFAPSK